jgi:hypothetical protein
VYIINLQRLYLFIFIVYVCVNVITV